MFHGDEAEIRAVMGHTIHENIGRYQEGGTSLLLYGHMVAQENFEHSRKNGTGPGRVAMLFRGFGGNSMQLVCGYTPCYVKKTENQAVYQ